MAQIPFAKWRALLPHGILEQTGVLLWLLGALAIALRFALALTEQPTFRAVLTTGALAFDWAALALALGGLGVGLLLALRRRAAGDPWLVLSRLGALAVECLLAATLMQLALRWAATDQLPLGHVGLLLLVAAFHIGLAAFHEHRSLPRRRP